MDATDHLEKVKFNTPTYNWGVYSSLPPQMRLTEGTSKMPVLIIFSTAEQVGISDQNYCFNERGIIGYAGTLKASAQEKIDRRYVEYLSEFSKKWHLKSKGFNVFTKDFVWDKFKVVIDKFLRIKPDRISFSLTEDCSIFFKSNVKGSNVYLELFFDENVDGGVESIVNVYHEGKVILAYGDTIDKTFTKIQTLFSVKDKIAVSTHIPNEISNTYFATAEL